MISITLFINILIFCATFGTSLYLLTYIDAWYLKKGVVKKLTKTGNGEYFHDRPDSGLLFNTVKFLGKFATPRKQNDILTINQKLIHAGFHHPDAGIFFFGFKIGFGLVFFFPCLLYIIFWGNICVQQILILFIPFSMGYFIPDLVLKKKINSRRINIFKELPDTLDLLMICLHAGLGFDFALYRVCRELADIAPVLSREFGLYFLEVKSGILRITALENLGDRNPSKSLKSLVAVLLQSSKTGTDMIRALEIHTNSLRTLRQQAAEEQGAKLSTKLTLPLVVFILPALILIILGPVIINFINLVKDGF